MYITEYSCHDCGAACILSPVDGRLLCPHCSRISCDFKPPDFQPAGEWDFHAADGVELAMAPCSGSITEHAHEYGPLFHCADGFDVCRILL